MKSLFQRLWVLVFLPSAIVLLAANCTNAPKESPLTKSALSDSLMSLSEEARIRLAAPVPSSGEVLGEWTRLRKEAVLRVGELKGELAVAALSQFIFEEKGFVREVDDSDIRFMLLPWVLRHRKGSCLGLAGLYLVLARDLGLPIHGVLVPGHFFLRLQQKSSRANIELLRKGERMPDEWYREKWPFDGKPEAYLRTLSDQETLAVFHFNLGNAHRKAQHLADAIRNYQRAISLFDTFAEAHASLGLSHQLRDDKRAAEKAYLRAKELQPGLPGLGRNLAVLRKESSASEQSESKEQGQ